MDIQAVVKEAVSAVGGSISAKKPGYKTTEFSLASTVATYLIVQDSTTHNWYYAALATGLVLTYTIVRTYSKCK